MCAIALAIAFVLQPHSAKAATTYTVDSIGDEADDNPGDLACHTALDTCTLRAAIQEVNAGTGGDTIDFGISGTGVHTIQPASCFDDITQSVTIDGYSQPGSAVNTAISPNPFNGTLTIEIDGGSAGNGCDGLNINTSNSTIRGLVINRFDNNGIRISNGVNNNINVFGNYLGTDTTGLVDLGNKRGISNSTGGTGVHVGSTNPAERNLVSGNSGFGMSTSMGTVIQGNYIGVAANGIADIGNVDDGIFMSSGNVTVGGTATGAMNVISGNGNCGIQGEGASNNTIQGNYIGLDATGLAPLSNDGIGGICLSGGSNNIIGGTSVAARNVITNNTAIWGGILMFESSSNTIQGNYFGTDKNGDVTPGLSNTSGVAMANNSHDILIGGTGVGEGNKIAGSTGSGVFAINIAGFGDAPLNNTIIGNDIEQNTESGIRLCNDTDSNFVCDTPEPYPNDAGDPDVGPNMFMNFPVINSATKGSGQVTVNYDLDINPAEVGATGYSVDFYANSTSDREGAIYLGSDIVPGSVTGQSATLNLPGSVPADYYVTAVTTMTDVSSDGYGHSSEFSAPVQAIAAPVPVPPTPTPTPSPSGNSSSLANTGQPQHTNQRLFIALTLIAAGVLGVAGLTGHRVYSKKKQRGRV